MAKLRVYGFLLIFIPVLLWNAGADAQDVPENELDVRINSYFDNFGVIVIYPEVTLNKKLGSGTSISGRYLSDIITAASMKANFQVDGITSATTKKVGGGDNTPDELRHEFGLSFNQKVAQGLLTLTGNYSIEHDYSSKTFAGSISYPFAKKNTILKLSFLRSLDKVFPQIWTWTKDRNTSTISAEYTQILSKNIITQIDASYSEVRGYMLDGYQVVRIILDTTTFRTLEPVEPDSRVRKAVGMRTNIGLSKKISLQLGYKYYWDSWDVKSHTISAKLSKNFSAAFSGSFEIRHYLQSKAFFFKPVYDHVEQYMTVEGQMNSGYSDEAVVNLVMRGNKNSGFLKNDKIELTGSAGFYRRYLDSPDWFTDLRTLYAMLISIGFRYNF